MLDTPSLEESSETAGATAVAAPPSGYVVRYGLTRFVAEFSPRGSEVYSRGTEVVVRSSRGTEWGEVLSAATPRTREFLGAREPEGRILRSVTRSDRESLERTREAERDAFKGGQEIIRESKLVMQLIDVESLFGGERLVFYYISEQRVDFRELVKQLAKRFRTRIEMRQIGVRDEAKLLADYGDCGKPVCCNTHLREMPPVSMKMAKMQKATLDPNKISGRCGRLKCCLRYEYDTYEAHRKELPKVGATVVTKQGRGKVFAVELLARKLIVQYDDHRRILTDEKDVLTIVRGGNPEPDREDANAADE
jgi:cell fate regulator YaaT (PSP1 superfamily)